MNRTLALVGRSPECKVLLSGNDVSLFHCSLVRTVLGVWVVNLLAREGTRVNGQLVRAALLEDGDELEVGHYRILLRYGSSTGQSSVSIPTRTAAPPSATPTHSIPDSSPQAFPRTFSPGNDSASDPAASMSMILAQRPNLPAMPDMRGILAGRSPEQIELAESVLVPVIHQFGQMHQQMFDQFQQMMMMAFQMFSTMHRDQMTVVRDEMAQIHRLTEELHTLQAQVQAVAEKQAQSAAPPPRPEAGARRPAEAAQGGADPDRSEEYASLAAEAAPARDAAPAAPPPPRGLSLWLVQAARRRLILGTASDLRPRFPRRWRRLIPGSSPMAGRTCIPSLPAGLPRFSRSGRAAGRS